METLYMAQHPQPRPQPQPRFGRRKKDPDKKFSEKIELRLTPPQRSRLEELKPANRDEMVPWLRDVLMDALSGADEAKRWDVPLLGAVCCGDGIEVQPFADSPRVEVDFPPSPTGYALATVGLSMVRPGGKGSIEPGKLIYLQPASRDEAINRIAHVRYQRSGQTFCTLKMVRQDEDGKIYLEPFNPHDTTLIPQDESWEIRGVYLRVIGDTPRT